MTYPSHDRTGDRGRLRSTEATSHFEPLHGHDEAHNVSSVSRD
ncbi:MAG: hypothetical protein ACNYPH_07050 [Gammaproteobacteria bacterium WSBS_2016_MAG_OTU1]